MPSLYPKLVCYSWITGIAEVARVVFVRKSLVEVQYLCTTITEEQREEFGRRAEGTIRRIEAADFLPHSSIRFPRTALITKASLVCGDEHDEDTEQEHALTQPEVLRAASWS